MGGKRTSMMPTGRRMAPETPSTSWPSWPAKGVPRSMSPTPCPLSNHQIRRTGGRRIPGRQGWPSCTPRSRRLQILRQEQVETTPPPPRRDPRTLPPRLGQPLASAPATCYKGGVALAAEATASDPGAPRVDRGADKSLAATFLDGRAGSPVSPSGSGKLMGGGGGWCGGARVSNELGVKMTKVSKVNTIYQ